MAINTGGRLVSGSHDRNEFAVINADEIGRIKSVHELSGQTCQICGDEVEITVDGELFVACNKCAFPVCWTCYEYEREEGNQACPHCKTRYKSIEGSPIIEGDEDEDDIDDLEHQFDYGNIEASSFPQSAGAMNSAHHGSAGSATTSRHDSSSQGLETPLSTYGEEDAEIAYNQNAIIVPPFASHGNGIHLTPPGTTAPLHLQPTVPEKDIALYGYGSVVWKDRMEDCEKRQNDRLQVVKHQGNSDGGNFDGSGLDPDLPIIVGCGPVDPTKGFIPQHLNKSNLVIERPYNVPVNQRYSFKDGVHKLWVFKTDKPHNPGSKTNPRTEIRIRGYNYSSGVWQFEAYGYVPSGTSGVCVMQVFRCRPPHAPKPPHATTLMLRVYDGTLTYYRAPVIVPNIYNRWFKLNVIHDVEANKLKVYIDGFLKYEGPGRGGVRFHYFKCGVYAQNDDSDYMESRWKNIRVLKKM
ncbi:hypothetical protein Pfo_007707 [Paulownia fortunei]|nr:hypothetical protein Pfo_007707 [Paulownia fortunei]